MYSNKVVSYKNFFIGINLALAFAVASTVEAGSFTFGLKAWNASTSVNGLDSSTELFFPGFYFSWGVNDRLWIAGGYIEGEFDFAFPGSTTTGSLKEPDSDILVGWKFARLRVGVGYRDTEFTTRLLGTADVVSSVGPTVFFAGSDLFGASRWGYYWSAAYMFEDIDDDDGSQEHFNGEAGFWWKSYKEFSILLGYRYKEFSGDGAGGLTLDGPVVNLAYTWNWTR